MISRHWRGVAKVSEADRYISHLRTETFPRLAEMPGFIDAAILRRSVTGGVEFRIVTTWTSIEAILQFSGADPEHAVVPEEVQAMMVTYERTVSHYEVVE